MRAARASLTHIAALRSGMTFALTVVSWPVGAVVRSRALLSAMAKSAGRTVAMATVASAKTVLCASNGIVVFRRAMERAVVTMDVAVPAGLLVKLAAIVLEVDVGPTAPKSATDFSVVRGCAGACAHQRAGAKSLDMSASEGVAMLIAQGFLIRLDAAQATLHIIVVVNTRTTLVNFNARLLRRSVGPGNSPNSAAGSWNTWPATRRGSTLAEESLSLNSRTLANAISRVLGRSAKERSVARMGVVAYAATARTTNGA